MKHLKLEIVVKILRRIYMYISVYIYLFISYINFITRRIRQNDSSLEHESTVTMALNGTDRLDPLLEFSISWI